MNDTERLIVAAERTAAEADRIGGRFARELASVLRDTERRLRDLLAMGGDTVSAVTLEARISRLRQQVRGALTAAGYDVLADAATQAPLDAIAAKVLRGRVLPEAGASEMRLSALKLLNLQNLLAEADVVSQEIGQALGRGLIGARKPAALFRDVREVVDGVSSRVQTIYDTAVSIFGRQVEREQAGDDADTVFAYMGPIDAKTRHWCLQHVGKVYTRKEIDTLDNGQLPDVFLTGGGYNCRHVWHEVSKFSELHKLQGTGDRAPEMREEVARVRKEKVH